MDHLTTANTNDRYDATYFRATWVLTALDAGFWTAMKIRGKWLRDLASIVFSVFYLFAAERADEKVRKVRNMITVDHLRVSWNKGTTPYLRFGQGLIRPRFSRWPPRQVRIPRPSNSDYKDSVSAWLYYDGPLANLMHHRNIILDIPGGGFVAMDPRCTDDKLFAWAAKSGHAILSLDYKKAPEFPYPYALNECFDVYTTLIKTRGRCIGMSGKDVPRVILAGDSAGGNLAVATTIMIIESSSPAFRRFTGREGLPAPDGLVCFYPALDMNIGNWMSDEQMALIRDRRMRKTNRSIVRRKSRQYNDLVGTPHHSDDEDDTPPAPFSSETSSGWGAAGTPPSDEKGPQSPLPEYSHAGPTSLDQAQAPEAQRNKSVSYHAQPMKTRLATSSMISYFNDRVLTPEMMRAMIILYIGPHNRPDFTQDYLLSPVLAPEALLAKFPKVFFMTGERDPLVDDTVIFAGRLRRAKEAAARGSQSPATPGEDGAGSVFRDSDACEVMLIPGISHGFLQFPALYPPAWKHYERCTGWFEHLFAHADDVRARRARAASLAMERRRQGNVNGRSFSLAESSGDEERPLEIGMTRMSRGRSSTQGHERDEHEKPPPPPTTTTTTTTNGVDMGTDRHEKKGKKGLSKNKSLVKLDSSEDLLGRRMEGLAGGLTGMGEND